MDALNFSYSILKADPQQKYPIAIKTKQRSKHKILGKGENLFPESLYYQIKMCSFQQQQQQQQKMKGIKTGKYSPFKMIKNT